MGLPFTKNWEATLPGTDVEPLGEYRGYIFHARQQGTSITTSAGTSGGPRPNWRYDYVVSIATTWYPYDGFFTSSGRQPIRDWRLALYPAFMSGNGPSTGTCPRRSTRRPRGSAAATA